MKWEEVRQIYPNSWVVFEAVDAYDENGYRIIEELGLIAAYDDSFWSAWKHYERLHKKYKQKEFLVYHTSNQNLEVKIITNYRSSRRLNKSSAMAEINDIVRYQVDQYAGLSLNATLQAVFDEVRQVYTVISVGKNLPARVVVMAKIQGDNVVIDVDTTDKPLVDALRQAGIPRDKIFLAYAGENSENTSQLQR